MLLHALLGLGTALAAPPSKPTVLIAPFEAQNSDASGLVTMLPDFLGKELANRLAVQVIAVEQVGPISGTDASIYAASCPRGEFVGCAYVLAEAGGATYAVTGQVQALESGSRVDVRIIDIATAREAVAFDVDMGLGDDMVFAEGVARVLGAVLRGEIGQETDARAEGYVPPPEGPDKSAANAELRELDQQIGGVDTVGTRDEGELLEEEYTEEDLIADMQSEGTKPWERVDMKPREYLRFKNAGVPLYQWRKLSLGRKGQLLLRGSLGFGHGATNAAYYGRVVRSSDPANPLVPKEIYAWQSLQTGNGVIVSGAAGYGIRPDLEVALTGGLVTGQFTYDIHSYNENDFSTAPAPTEVPSSNLFFGPQVLYVPLPTSSIRPVVGGQAIYWRGSSVDSHVVPPEGLPGSTTVDSLGSPSALFVGALGGVEVKLGPRLDLWAHVPVSAGVAYWNAPADYQQGESEEDPFDSPDPFSTINTGIQLGVQVRALGPGKGKRTLEDYE